MSFHVLVLRTGGSDFPCGRSRPLDAARLGEGNEAEWRRLCRLILRLAQREPLFSAEVFVCLTGNEIRQAPDRARLKGILTLAREHTWGARIFLVAPAGLVPLTTVRPGSAPADPTTAAAGVLQALDVPMVPPLSMALLPFRQSWQQWLDHAIRGRAIGLLQLQYDPGDVSSLSGAALRGAVDRASERLTMLTAPDVAENRWRVVVDREWRSAQNLLQPILASPATDDCRSNVLVLGRGRQLAKLKAQVKRAAAAYGARCRLVVLLSEAGLKEDADLVSRVPAELGDFCRSLGLPRPFECDGILELWYFVSCLNERSAEQGAQALADREHDRGAAPNLAPRGSAIEVPLDATPVFRPLPSSRPTEIVVTSAFNPNDDCDLDAARDIGRFIELAPFGFTFIVEPAVNLGRLIGAVERLPEVWIHLGHGDDGRKMWEADTKDDPGRSVPQELWLDCFRIVEGHRLSLAIFLTCGAAAIAERFARAGVGVAVGFEMQADSRKCRELAVPILRALMAWGAVPAVLLRGFDQGCYAVTAQEAPGPSQPVAFFPQRT